MCKAHENAGIYPQSLYLWLTDSYLWEALMRVLSVIQLHQLKPKNEILEFPEKIFSYSSSGIYIKSKTIPPPCAMNVSSPP